MVPSEKKKSIVIINQYASTPGSGMGGRHYYIARELVKNGCDVTIVSANFSHILKKPVNLSGDVLEKDVDGVKYIYIKTSEYDGAHSSVRVLNWFRFAFALLRLNRSFKLSADAVVYSSPSPIGVLSAYYLSLKLGARFVFEIRDIWPKTLVSLGNISKYHPLIMLMQLFEKVAYKKCSFACSNLENAVEHMGLHGLPSSKFSWIPNGVCVPDYDLLKEGESPYRRELDTNKLLIGYAGSIGLANSLNSFLEAAKALKDDRRFAFVLIGNGEELDRLRAFAIENCMSNVKFLPAIEKRFVYPTLDLFDICFIGWNSNPLYRYGIAPNKIPEYMITGKPILHAYSGNCDPISRSGGGITVPAENASMIENALIRFHEMGAKGRQICGEKGRSYALEHFDYSKIAAKYLLFVEEGL